MAIPFHNLPHWPWSKPDSEQLTSPSSASPVTALCDTENVQYAVHTQTSLPKSSINKMGSPPLKSVRRPGGRRRWQRRSERARSDPEFDVVLVPSDGVCCISGSDSEDSDWSIGWFEPHSSDFCSDNESENSFAVLVPCYGSPFPECFGGRGRFPIAQEESSKSQLWAAVLSNISQGANADGKPYLDQWLSSLER